MTADTLAALAALASEQGHTGTQSQEGDKRGAGSKCEATHDTGMVTLACTRRPGHPSLHFDGHYWLSWG